MSNAIVIVNATIQQAPAPSTLQQSGALLTQGGTNTAPGTLTLLTSASLSTLAAASVVLTALSWSDTVAIQSGTYNEGTGLVTLVCAAPAAFSPGQSVTIAGATGSGSVSDLDGTFTAGSGSSGTTLTYTIATGLTMTITSGGTATVPGYVTATVGAALGWTVGTTQHVTIAGCTPAAYNGLFAATVQSTETVTYPLATNPGAETVLGTIALGAVAELQQMATTFFANPAAQSVYVLELGQGSVATGVTELQTFIAGNPKTIYAYLVPREWDAVEAFTTILTDYTAPNAFTYFFVTTTVANRAVYAGLKCVFAEVEAPTIGANEFSLASAFATTLGFQPSSSSQVPPLSYAYAYGVTPYPIPGNQAVFAELKAANVGYIGTGQEGGISNTILFYGRLSDGNSWNFWYSADWIQINLDLDLANEVINGSNNKVNPLLYNQPGIDRLQNRGVQTMNTGVSNGLGNGQVIATKLPAAQFQANLNQGLYNGKIVLNAEPFLNYTTENPSDYAEGVYDGLTGVWITQEGFVQIVVNLNVTDLV